MLVERLKYNLYTGRLVENYFWRTYDQQEIDLIEGRGEGGLHAAEMKWSPQPATRVPRAWRQAYGDSFIRGGSSRELPRLYLWSGKMTLAEARWHKGTEAQGHKGGESAQGARGIATKEHKRRKKGGG